MANMSYCRFHNTLLDLNDCYEALANDNMDDLSDEEKIAMKRLIDVCCDISADFNYLVTDN